MRFRATLADEQVSLLYSLVVSIARLTSSTHNGPSGDSGASGIGDINGDGRLRSMALAAASSSSSLVRNGCMLYLDDDHVRFSVRGGHRNDAAGVSSFVELQATGGIFVRHRIESIAEKNGILMELDVVQLRMALQSIQQQRQQQQQQQQQSSSRTSLKKRKLSASERDDSHDNYRPSLVVLKLSKRNQTPCLCLDTGTTTTTTSEPGVMQVHHAIPVRMTRAMELQHHLPPSLPLPTIQLQFDADQTPLRTVLERLRVLSPTVYVTAECSGDELGQVTIATHTTSTGVSMNTVLDRFVPCMENCQPRSRRRRSPRRNGGTTEQEKDDSSPNTPTRHEDDEDEAEEDDLVQCTIKVDTRKLALCLQWQQPLSSSLPSLASQAVLCWVENEALVLHVMLEPSGVGFLTYYIPVHFLSPEEGGTEGDLE